MSKPSIKKPVIVLVSAQAEWQAIEERFPDSSVQHSPFGACFAVQINHRPLLFFHGGWGKISAAASTQYVIDRWQPSLLINLGTCGGFAGLIDPGQIILVEETLVYDILEQMGDPAEAIAHYTTRLDLSWLQPPFPQPVVRGRLVSADRDICPADILELQQRYGAIAADWESGAIAWVAARNHTPCLILRGVSDLVDASGGEAYGSLPVFQFRARAIMHALLDALPDWLSIISPSPAAGIAQHAPGRGLG
jgi:adenosylhomocysteine nucleosidase